MVIFIDTSNALKSLRLLEVPVSESCFEQH